MPPNERLFRQRAEAFAAYHRDGREPDLRSDDPDERTLARWIEMCRDSAAGKPSTFAWSPERHALLDDLAPGWRPTGPRARRNPAPGVLSGKLRDDRRFRANADDYARFLSTHGTPPSMTSDDPREVQLSRWMIRNRQQSRGLGLSPLYPDRRELLDRMFPGWLDSDAGYRFRLRAEFCAAWLRSHGTLPSHQSAFKPERELGRWLQQARRSADAASGTRPWNEAREQLLDTLLPGWREEVATREDEFEKRAHEYAAFLARRGRHPSHSPEKTERSLYQWMIRNRRCAQGKGRHPLNAERTALLDEIAPGWNRPLKEPPPPAPPAPAPASRRYWPDGPGTLAPLIPRLHEHLAERARDCARFIGERRRFPRPAWGDRAEQSLGSWLATMRHDADVMHRRERDMLDEIVPGWSCTDVRHRRRAEWCAEFLDLHSRWPATLGDLPRERELAAFLHECRVNARGDSARKWSPAHAAYLDNLVPGWRERPGMGR